MEIWDAYDQNFRIVPHVTLVRPGPIPTGFFHLFCDVIVRHTDGSYLLMQRDRRKYFFPGMWEVTAGGSALRYETPLDCAIRELREETGIRAGRMIEAGRLRNDDTFFVQYLCVTNCGKDSIVLQPGETMAYTWADRSELLSMRDVLVTERLQYYLDRNARFFSRIREKTGLDLPQEPHFSSDRRSVHLAGRLYLHGGSMFDWPVKTAGRIPSEPGADRAFCYGLISQFGVLADGSVVPCCLDSEGAMTLGNMDATPLREILASPRAAAIREGFRNGIAAEPFCRTCTYRERHSAARGRKN